MTDDTASDWMYEGDRVRVREIRPGDGFVCIEANKQRLVPCATPIALIEVLAGRGARTGTTSPRWTKRIVCARHLLAHVAPVSYSDRNAVGSEAVKQIVAAHRSEYEAIVERLKMELAQEQMQRVPVQLANLIGPALGTEVPE